MCIFIFGDWLYVERKRLIYFIFQTFDEKRREVPNMSFKLHQEGRLGVVHSFTGSQFELEELLGF